MTVTAKFIMIGFACVSFLTACKPESQFTPAEKEEFDQQCVGSGGTPTVITTSRNQLQLTCSITFDNGYILGFNTYEVRPDGIWVSADWRGLEMFRQTCVYHGGEIIGFEPPEMCVINGQVERYLRINTAYDLPVPTTE